MLFVCTEVTTQYNNAVQDPDPSPDFAVLRFHAGPPYEVYIYVCVLCLCVLYVSVCPCVIPHTKTFSVGYWI